jgi:hypothetical protein
MNIESRRMRDGDIYHHGGQRLLRANQAPDAMETNGSDQKKQLILTNLLREPNQGKRCSREQKRDRNVRTPENISGAHTDHCKRKGSYHT